MPTDPESPLNIPMSISMVPGMIDLATLASLGITAIAVQPGTGAIGTVATGTISTTATTTATTAAVPTAPNSTSPFTPNPPFEKTRGDIIRSEDWNELVKETLRLGSEKVSKTGDTMTGPLSISGSVNFGAQVRQMINLWRGNYGIGVQNWTQYYRSDKNFAWYQGGSHNDNEADPGGGQTLMIIRDKNVGIGTATPQKAKLQIHGMVGNTVGIFGDDTTGIALVASWPSLGFNTYFNSGWKSIATGFTGIIDVNQGEGGMHFHTGGNAGGADQPVDAPSRMRITADGELHVNGKAVREDSKTTWDTPSDINLKKNVQTLVGALETLLELRGVTFEWKEPEKMANQKGTQIGLIAQEVEKVIPEWVGEMEDGMKCLSISGFEALVIEALRSIHLRLEKLEEGIRV